MAPLTFKLGGNASQRTPSAKRNKPDGPSSGEKRQRVYEDSDVTSQVSRQSSSRVHSWTNNGLQRPIDSRLRPQAEDQSDVNEISDNDSLFNDPLFNDPEDIDMERIKKAATGARKAQSPRSISTAEPVGFTATAEQVNLEAPVLSSTTGARSAKVSNTLTYSETSTNQYSTQKNPSATQKGQKVLPRNNPLPGMYASSVSSHDVIQLRVSC